MDRHGVISVPIVQNSLYLVSRDSSSDVIRRLGVVELAGGMFVDWGKINNTSRIAIRLRGNEHSTAPLDWNINWDFFDYTQSDITI